MSTNDPATCAAAIELADAILAEFNDSSSKLKGFGTVSIEKLVAYEKVVAKALKSKAKRPS